MFIELKFTFLFLWLANLTYNFLPFIAGILITIYFHFTLLKFNFDFIAKLLN